MKKRLLITFSLIISAVPLLAQGTSTSFSELTLPKNAQTAALASSNITSYTIEASFLNPAILAGIQQPTILLSSSRWIQETSTYCASVAYPTTAGTLALTLWTAQIPDIEIRTIPGDPEGIFTYHSSYLSASYGTSLFNGLDLGISGKYLFNKIYLNEFDGYSIDAGLLYHLPAFDIALALTDLGSIDGLSEKNTVPTTIRLGGSHTFVFLAFQTTGYINFSSEIHSKRNHVHLGVEANYNDDAFIRLGYVSGYDSHGLAFGCGFQYSLVRINYAFIPFSYSLGDTHLLSLNFVLD